MGIPHAGRSVLLVEDNDDARQGYALFLGRLGFSTSEASTGESALVMAGELSPDVIVMDVGLPGMSGLEVLERLRQNPATRGIPVILVTGTDLHAAQASTGAATCLTKPVAPAELLACIEGLIGLGH